MFSIDDYATKDGGPGEVRLFAVFTMSLCTLELKQTLISLPFQVLQLLDYFKQALKPDLRITYKYQLHILRKNKSKCCKGLWSKLHKVQTVPGPLL